MDASDTKENSQRLLDNDLVLLALQVGVPVAFINIIGFISAATRISAISILKLPIGDWAPILCALWVLLVLNCGPFVVPCAGQNRARGANRCR